VLQRLAEVAERVHALLDRLAAEHVDAQLQPALVQFFVVHRRFLSRLPFASAPV
jgi:hypothetical protein